MLKTTKTLFEGEKIIRRFNRNANEIFIDQLIREDLELKEKERITESAKKILADDEQFEEETSKYWYKYGLVEGKAKGAFMVFIILLISGAFNMFTSKK